MKQIITFISYKDLIESTTRLEPGEWPSAKKLIFVTKIYRNQLKNSRSIRLNGTIKVRNANIMMSTMVTMKDKWLTGWMVFIIPLDGILTGSTHMQHITLAHPSDN